MYISLKMKYT